MLGLILRGSKLHHLKVPVNLFAFSNSFSSAIAPNVTLKDKNFTVSYLVKSLGLAKNQAESISRKVSLEDKSNPDSVLSLLKSHGFTDSQISRIVSDYPLLLIADAEKSVGLKLQFLQSRGASSSELTQIVSTVPKILGMKQGKSISRYYDFVKVIIEAKDSSKLCHSLPQGSKQENKIRNVLVLRELGVPQRFLFSLLISNHHVCYGKEKFEESLKKIVELGFKPTTKKFVKALCIVYGLSDKRLDDTFSVYKRFGFAEKDIWNLFMKCPDFLGYSVNRIIQTFETLKRCGLLENEVLSVFKKHPLCLRASEQQILNFMEICLSLGFSKDEYLMMVKRFPQCMGYSAETVKKKTEFMVKKMNWPLKDLTFFPQVFGYSMEKRIVPRGNVIKALMSTGSLRSKLPPIVSVLACTDEAFLNRYVKKHNDNDLVLKLMAIFTKDPVS